MKYRVNIYTKSDEFFPSFIMDEVGLIDFKNDVVLASDWFQIEDDRDNKEYILKTEYIVAIEIEEVNEDELD